MVQFGFRGIRGEPRTLCDTYGKKSGYFWTVFSFNKWMFSLYLSAISRGASKLNETENRHIEVSSTTKA